MYNRYTPQPDGSYSRRLVQDTSAPPPLPQPELPPREEHWQPEPQKTKQDPTPKFHSGASNPCRPNPRRQRQCHRPVPPAKQEPVECRQNPRSNKQETSILSFLKQLLPKDFDTGDLLIVLLLLLMSGDCQEDQNTAILTLVLYLFM